MHHFSIFASSLCPILPNLRQIERNSSSPPSYCISSPKMFTCGLRRSLLRPTSLPRSHFLSNPISPAISSQPFTSISDFNLPRVGFDTEFTLGKLGGPDKKSFGFADDNFEPEATPEHLQDPRTFTAKKKWSLCEDYAYAIAQLPSKAGNANSDKFDAPLPQAVPPAQVLATLNAVRSRWNDKFSNEAVPPIDMVRAACVVSLGVQEMQAFAELPEEKEEDLEKEEEGEDGEGGADIEAANSEEADGEEEEAKVEEEEAKVEEEEEEEKEKEEEEEDNKSFKPTQKHYLNNDSFFPDPPDYAALLKQYHSHDDPAESITSLRGRLGLFDKDEAAVAEALAFEKETEEVSGRALMKTRNIYEPQLN